MEAAKFVIVGTFAAPHGIHGWIKIHSSTEPPEAIFDYLPWQYQTPQGWQSLLITETKQEGMLLLARVKNYDTRESVAKLTNHAIGVPRDQLPEPAADEYYWSDLVGLTVINQEGITLGKIDSLFSTGANDVIIVTGEKRHLLPYLDSVVLKIDLSEQQIRVDWDDDF